MHKQIINNALFFNLQVIGHDTEEFALLKKYVKNTHAATHSQYSLEVEEV